MWEAIRQNKFRSLVLLGLLGSLMVLLGAVIGAAAAGDIYIGAAFGAVVALLTWLLLLVVAFFAGDKVMLSSTGAKKIEKPDSPQLWNVVEEMTIASGLVRMPSIYIMEDDSPNAFAVGRSEETASVAVTSGLLRRLNRDELQGVIAHEIGHIQNYDVRFMTIAGVTMGATIILSDIFLRGMLYGGGRRRSSSTSRGGGKAQLIMLGVAVIMAILAPIAAQALYFSCSRRREYLADACSARYTRYPAGLASALEKIARHHRPSKKVNRTVAPMYTVNPLQGRSAMSLFSTHPPTEARVKILRSMAGGAGFVDYEKAYREVHGKDNRCLSDDVVRGEAERVQAREGHAEPEENAGLERAREVLDFLGRTAGMLLIPCMCGMRIKVPSGFKADMIKCPRCGTEHAIPKAKGEEQPAKQEEEEQPEPLKEYRRQGNGWESFQCSCGQTLHLGPSFAAPQIKCRNCKRKIKIIQNDKQEAVV
jgi:heat shock protein HtpX